ncbi:TRPM8 channel-associated factor homolog [Antedon mediterranea]|uniref:TRPM8 channel-associated factor homolog n=1 Tax=Antedon mediterranea TaxID=105859 RepID=UPI003AF96DF8
MEDSTDPSVSLSYILDGVGKNIDFKSVSPSQLILYGENTFSVVEWENGDGVAVAASHVGSGRSMHWGNKKFLKKCIDDGTETLKLAENSFKWLARYKTAARVGSLKKINKRTQEVLENIGFTINKISIDDNFEDYDILFAGSDNEYTQEHLDKIHKFLSNGRGLLTDGNNWVDKKDSASNIVKPSGIIIGTTTSQSDSFVTSDKASQPLRNVSLTLQQFIRHAKSEIELEEPIQRKYRDYIWQVFDDVPPTCITPYKLAKEYLKISTDVIPTKECPVDILNQPKAGSYAFIYSKLACMLPPSDLQEIKHASAVFPGDVPSTLQPSSKTMAINATYDGLLGNFPSSKTDVMRSTGLYAAPAKSIKVTIPMNSVGSGLKVEIGCTTDSLHKKESIYRFPKITRSFELNSITTKASNVFGGLVYILVPAKTNLGIITITIDDAFQSPQFVSGTTSADDWKQSLETLNVPYCELISNNCIISLPTANALEHCNDVVEIMDIYEGIVGCCAELSGIPTQRPREERIVLDIQVSKGKMHSGYPIMGPISNSNKMFNVESVRKNNIWGPIHELGHQHQSKGWNPSGTVEATCNLFSVYASEKVLQIPRALAHSALDMEKRKARIQEYIASGSKYENWNSFTCLETYLQLQEAFDWKFLIDMLSHYNKSSFEPPKSNTDQLDLWMVVSSQLAGFNLGTFYKAWGWPVTDEALQSIKHLPDWEKNPMLTIS